MRFTTKTLKLCEAKYAKGKFTGFENEDFTDEELNPEEIGEEMQFLIDDGIVDVDNDTHISPLGQHVFHMMTEPDQYIYIDNKAKEVSLRMYIRDTYYLSVLEDQKEKTENGDSRYLFKLLPTLDMVVGGFAYAIRSGESDEKENDDKGIVIQKTSWGKEREVISSDSYEGTKDECDLINDTTKWLFDSIAEMYAGEVN